MGVLRAFAPPTKTPPEHPWTAAEHAYNRAVMVGRFDGKALQTLVDVHKQTSPPPTAAETPPQPLSHTRGA